MFAVYNSAVSKAALSRHKAKGKELDEVVIYEGTFPGRILTANIEN